ncbi:MAG: TIGR00266 family protein [Clostridia bacterium]|nr:TIGR00266 family protein [Clostridia bacterium]
MRYSIEGGNLPAVMINLEAGETIISEVGGRTWLKGPIETETKAIGGAGKSIGRMFMGESIFMSEYTANGSSEIAFTSSFPGKILAIELAAGQSVICQKSAFMCATKGVELSVFFRKKFGAGLFGGEGFIMQKITGPGKVFLELDGYVKEYDLMPGEKIVCDTGVIALMDESCTMDVQMVKGLKNKLLGGEGLVDTTVTGPGKVYLQTMSVAKLAGLIRPYMPTGGDGKGGILNAFLDN